MSDSKIKDCLLSKEKPENLDDLAATDSKVGTRHPQDSIMPGTGVYGVSGQIQGKPAVVHHRQ